MSARDREGRPSHRGSASVRRSHRGTSVSRKNVRNSSAQDRPSAGSAGSGAQGRAGYSQSTRSTGSAGRASASSGGNGGGDIKKYIIIGVAAAALIIAGVFLVKNFTGGVVSVQETQETFAADAFRQDAAIDVRNVISVSGGESGTADAEGDDEASSDAAALPAGVISIYGKTPDEVRSEIMALYEWDLRVVNPDASVGDVIKPTVDPSETTAEATMGDPENPDSLGEGETAAESRASEDITVTNAVEVPDLILQNLNSLLMDIEAEETAAGLRETGTSAETEEAEEDTEEGETEPAGPVIYTLSLDNAEEAIADAAELCDTMWYKAPKGASIGSYDAETDKFVMEGAESGFEVDRDAVSSALSVAINNKEYVKEIEVVGNALSADSATNLDAYKIIGTYTTNTTSNSVRNKNIRLACEALNGTIVFPGQEFSFNDAVGQRTAEKGYGAAAAYNNGEVVQEIGGGVCQVSTTLYNAVLRSGLKTTRRQSHTFKPTYVTPGFDATISWGGPDYCFANTPADPEYSNSETYAIGIYAKYSDQTVTVSIYGRPVLKDGYTYDLESEKIKDIPVVRKLIEPGSDQQPTTGSMGSQWQTYLIVKKDGEQIKRTLDHNTYYSGHVEYYTDETTTLAPTLPIESDPSGTMESESETQIIEGLEGGPGVGGLIGSEGTGSGPDVSGGPGTSETPTETPTAPQAGSGGPGSDQAIVPTAPSDIENPGPGVISGGPQ